MFEKIGIASTSLVIGLALGWIASDVIEKTHEIERKQQEITKGIEKLYDYLVEINNRNHLG